MREILCKTYPTWKKDSQALYLEYDKLDLFWSLEECGKEGFSVSWAVQRHTTKILSRTACKALWMLESSGLQTVAWSLGLAHTAGKLRRHLTFLKGTDKKKEKHRQAICSLQSQDSFLFDPKCADHCFRASWWSCRSWLSLGNSTHELLVLGVTAPVMQPDNAYRELPSGEANCSPMAFSLLSLPPLPHLLFVFNHQATSLSSACCHFSWSLGHRWRGHQSVIAFLPLWCPYAFSSELQMWL